ncbi:MAG: hypothetical protein JWN95_2049 [Frankiales bacterium]|nr:hypothetical protein [Frankiales bacterium]
MKRLLIGSAVVAGVIAAGIPAAAGLSGNASFSHKLPVRVPSQAQVVKFDDHGHATDDSSAARSPQASATATATPRATRTAEPGDDNGGLRTTKTAEPGDDNGGLRTTKTAEPGDDNSGNSGSSNSGSDDSGHGSELHGSGH